MLKIRLKDPEAATSLKVKSIKASMHANSTLIHKTALLNVGYDCDVKVEKKAFYLCCRYKFEHAKRGYDIR